MWKGIVYCIYDTCILAVCNVIISRGGRLFYFNLKQLTQTLQLSEALTDLDIVPSVFNNTYE